MDAPQPNPPASWALLEPDPRAIFSALKPVADGDVLRALAACDAGQNSAGHETALRAMLQTGTLPSPLGWVPGEVLTLGRFDEPESARFGRRGTVDPRRGHALRAVACAGLVLAACDPANQGESWASADDAARLAASAAAIGGTVLAGARSMLAWAAMHDAAWGDERAHVALSAVLLAATDAAVPLAALGPASDWANDLRQVVRRPRPGRWTASSPDSPVANELSSLSARLRRDHPERADAVGRLIGDALG